MHPPSHAYDPLAMSPALLLTVLVVGLLALIPVWRLNRAGWSSRWLAATWVALAAALLVVVRAPAAGRFLVPLLILAFLAPFVASPERVARLLRREPRGIVIDVTPRLGIRPPSSDVDVDPDTGSEPPEPRDPNGRRGA